MIETYYKSVTVQRLTETINAFGAVTKTWNTIGTVQGLINKVGPKEYGLIANQYQVVNPYNFYTTIGANVKLGDKVVKDGVKYRVATHEKNTVERNHHLKFILERLDADV
jgi:hypothetical protein